MQIQREKEMEAVVMLLLPRRSSTNKGAEQGGGRRRGRAAAKTVARAECNRGGSSKQRRQFSRARCRGVRNGPVGSWKQNDVENV